MFYFFALTVSERINKYIRIISVLFVVIVCHVFWLRKKTHEYLIITYSKQIHVVCVSFYISLIHIRYNIEIIIFIYRFIHTTPTHFVWMPFLFCILFVAAIFLFSLSLALLLHASTIEHFHHAPFMDIIHISSSLLNSVHLSKSFQCTFQSKTKRKWWEGLEITGLFNIFQCIVLVNL